MQDQRNHSHELYFRFKDWKEFCDQFSESERLSFLYNANQKTFQVDALKDGQVSTYSGPLPELDRLLKSWLSSQLGIPSENIFKGSFCPRPRARANLTE